MSLSKEEAKLRLEELDKLLDETYAEMAELAVEHQIYVSVSGPAYGMGGWVNLEDYEGTWGETEVAGTWQASSGSC